MFFLTILTVYCKISAFLKIHSQSFHNLYYIWEELFIFFYVPSLVSAALLPLSQTQASQGKYSPVPNQTLPFPLSRTSHLRDLSTDSHIELSKTRQMPERYDNRMAPSGLVWFLPSGVVILDTAPLRGAVYYNPIIIIYLEDNYMSNLLQIQNLLSAESLIGGSLVRYRASE